MNAEKVQQEVAPQAIQQKRESGALCLKDNRTTAVTQAKMIETIQRQGDEEDELLQGKFVTQLQGDDEDEMLQGKFEPVQRMPENHTGIPDPVKQRMESSFNADFSDVRVHPESSSAPEVGALAYTQGTDIHFAPGQFKPDTSAGQQLLGHELTHVVQQKEGRVQATTEVGGMPVNDNAGLEHEADVLGAQAAE